MRRFRPLFLLVLPFLGLPPAAQEAPAPAPPAGTTAPAATPAAPRTTRLQGTAFFDRRNPVIGAVVLARPQAGGPRIWVTATDDRGRFRIEGLPEGEYRVDLRRADVMPVVKESVRLQAPFFALVELTVQRVEPGTDKTLPPTGPGAGGSGPFRLAGRTLDREGRPVPDVRVRLVNAAGAFDPVTLVSGTDGAVAVEGLPAGTWKTEVLGVGFVPIRTAFTLDRDLEVVAALVPQPTAYEPQPLDLLVPEEPLPPPVPSAPPPAS